MTKRLALLLLIIAFACSAWGYSIYTTSPTLTDSSGTAITDYALTSGAAVTTAAFDVRANAGYAVLVVTEEQAGGTGDVDIYATYSIDGTNFYRPYVSNMSGTITQEGNIVTTLQNVTRYIIFTPRLGNKMKITFDPDADSNITAKLIYLKT